MKFGKFLRTPPVAASGDGSVKLYSRNVFAEHILLENVCQWLHIEKLKTAFHLLKEKIEKKISD